MLSLEAEMDALSVDVVAAFSAVASVPDEAVFDHDRDSIVGVGDRGFQGGVLW